MLKNILREPQTQLPILLGDFINLREGFTPKQRFSRTVDQKSMKIGELRAQLAIILRDSKNLEGFGLVGMCGCKMV